MFRLLTNTNIHLSKLFASIICSILSYNVYAYSDATIDDALNDYNNNNYQEALDKFTPFAKHGNDTAQYYLGLIYYLGNGVPQNDVLAAQWYRKAADQGLAIAQTNIGRIYYKGGKGINQDYFVAAGWYEKAAEQGDAEAQYSLGVLYFNGLGIKQDYTTALKWYTKAADQDYAPAQYNLGDMYNNGLGVHQDYTIAIQWYTKAAEQGNANAQLFLGGLYDKGEGVPQNYSLAFQWYRKSAEQGNACSQQSLGLMYALGQGVDQDNIQAHFWFNVSATINDSNYGETLSQQIRSNAQKYRSLVEKDMTTEQINQAQALAHEWFGQHRTYGDISISDLQKESFKGNQQAIEKIKELATQSNDTAQLILGGWYEYGENVLQNYDTAMSWYQKSADLGYAEALRSLSLMFYKGHGMNKDIVQSYFWLKIAGILDNNMDEFTRRIIVDEMSVDQIVQANKLCDEWLKTHKNILSSLNHTFDKDTSALSKFTNSKDSISTGRNRKSIMAVVNNNLKYLRYAYNRRLHDRGSFKGTIITKFAVDEFGKVVFCHVRISNMNDEKLESAVVEIIKHWVFDKVDKPNDVTEIIYPFVFSQ